MADITEFNLPVDSYAAFDAQSMRDLIIQRLNDSPSIFTDQNFEGSNLNAIIDVIAYSFHTLLFYLNQTSSEAMFSDAQLYENMNRIVKLLDYKPLGRQSSIVPIELRGSTNLSSGYYTIPRFSFITSKGKTYSTTKDISFRKLNNNLAEDLTIIDNSLFNEGKYKEYPNVNAIGEDFETVSLLPGPSVSIDHFSIKIFVKEFATSSIGEDRWYEYERVPSLYLSNPNARAFECRFNENKNYEIKFGNNINGKRLKPGETIAIYYIASSEEEGQITKNNFSGTTINVYNTTKYDEIFNDVKDVTVNYVSVNDSVEITATNTEDSTEYSTEETVEQIRSNTPKFFSSEYKLITKQDYESFITRNFKNLTYDIKASNNSDYVNNFLDYTRNELGMASYTEHNNALYNQYQYSDSFNVNNIFLTIIPKFKKGNSVVTRSNYLPASLKNEILFEMRKYKMLNAEICFLDPVYLAVDFAVKRATENNVLSYKDSSKLIIYRNNSSIVNDETIKNKVVTILQNYFTSCKLGKTIDIQNLNSQILSIQGVDSFVTARDDDQLSKEGLNLGVYNPIHNGKDFKIIDTNFKLRYFQIPYIEDMESIKNKISVIPVTKQTTVEY